MYTYKWITLCTLVHCESTILKLKKEEREWRLTINEHKGSYLGDRSA